MATIPTILFLYLFHSSILQSHCKYYIGLCTDPQNGARVESCISFFDNDDVITPTPPISPHFSLISKTEASVYLTWKSNNHQTNGFYDVKYKFDQTKWISINVSVFELVHNELRVNVTNLHPNTEYEFGLFRKLAIDRDWSLLESLRIRTEDCAPYRPPTTDAGSFRVERLDNGLRTLRISWQPLPKLEHNGYGFHYKITVLEEGDVIREIKSWSESSHVIADLSLKRQKFVISSANYVGDSSAASVVHVPAQAEILQPPTSFMLERDDGTYEYDWKVENPADVAAITLVRCKRAGHSCGQIVEYIGVATDAISYDGKLDHDETVKIILHSATSTSGIAEPMCRTSGENLGEMSVFAESKFTGKHLEITWPLMCPEHGIVKGTLGYNIFFCVAENNTCVEPEMKETVYEEGTTLYGILVDVRLDEVYQISTNVIMENAVQGPRSAPVYVSTSNDNVHVNSLLLD